LADRRPVLIQMGGEVESADAIPAAAELLVGVDEPEDRVLSEIL